MATPAGVKWEATLFGSKPQWTVEPSTEIITKLAHHHLRERVSMADKPIVKFLSQGAFNKVYAITSPQIEFVMRVSLPVDPRFKTRSEVAVLKLLYQITSIPVPEIIAFDASSHNELGLEWILMKRVPGNPLNKIWGSMAWSTKCGVVGQIADIIAKLFRIRCGEIGNIFLSKDVRGASSQSTGSSLPSEFVVNRIVSMSFFWDKRLLQDVPRGPFPSSRMWMTSRLTMAMNDCKRVLEEQADPDDVEDAEVTKSLVLQLSEYMSKIFPPNSEKEEQFAVHHDDISEENILVCVHGNIQALVDWECVSCVPLWKACQFPSFLRGRDRHEEPQRETYGKNEDGTPNELFIEHFIEYEKTLLRQVFLTRMAQTEPGWIKEFKTSTAKADFDFAVENCDNPVLLKRISKWLNNIAGGREYQSLRELAMH